MLDWERIFCQVSCILRGPVRGGDRSCVRCRWLFAFEDWWGRYRWRGLKKP